MSSKSSTFDSVNSYKLLYDNSDILIEAGIRVAKQPIQITGQLLETPEVQYGTRRMASYLVFRIHFIILINGQYIAT